MREADVRAVDAQRARLVLDADDGVQGLPRERQEQRRALGQIHVHPAPREAREQLAARAVEEGLAPGLRAQSADDAVRGARTLDEVRDESRRIAFRADHDDDVADHRVEAGQDRHLDAERAREPQRAHALVLPQQAVEDARRVVRRAVVHDHDLVALPACADDGGQLLEEAFEDVRVVAQRDDDRHEDIGDQVHDVASSASTSRSMSKMLSILPPTTQVRPGRPASHLKRIGRLSSTSLAGRIVFSSHSELV